MNPFDDPFDSDYSAPDSPFDDPSALGVVEPQIVEEGDSRKMPHPLTGKMTKFTRASSWGGTISDPYMITEWKMAMVALGMGDRDDLHDLSASTPKPQVPVEKRDQGWWTPWRDIAHMCIDAARAKSGAHKGTAVHQWGEQLDRGVIDMGDVPARYRPHMEAYQRVREEAGLSVHPEYMEQLVLTLKLHNGVCGRLDGLRTGPGGWLIVDDTKTGKQAVKGLDEIAVQLSIYANAEWHWQGGDTPNYGWVPAPLNIRQDVASMTWVPIDNPDGAQVVPVDIVWGWQAARVAAWVRGYRNRAARKYDNLTLPLSAFEPSVPWDEYQELSLQRAVEG